MKQSTQATSKKMTQTQVAQKRFELENEIIDEPKTYHFDKEEIQKILAEKPWSKNPDYFKKVKISAVALIKMVIHARSGGDIEVMGLMQGYPVGDTMYVMDSFGLPVEATETRVNAGREADDYMFAHLKKSKQVARAEGICGWYHSHPGYGCWLSGIDVNTQQNYQQIQDPAIAIVIDPKRTIAAGKVEIGCFRAYKNDHAEKILQNYKQQTGSAIIPGEKFNEFGLHAHKYYKLEHTFFKSGLDTTLLERLWNEYWVHTLASSPLLSNQDIICKSVINIADKLSQIQASKSTQRGLLNSGSENKLIEEEKFAPLAAEGSKVALGVSQGIIVEALKKFMFACQPHDHAICCKQEADVQMAEEQKE